MTVVDFQFQLQNQKGALRAFAMSLTKSGMDADDLIQDTIYRALTNLDKFKEGTNLKAWLLTIMRNIFINNYRKAMRRNTIIDQSDNHYLINSSSRTIENAGDRNMLMESLEEVIGGLKPEFRDPFMMHYKGFKYDEIAEKLDLPLGTVKSRIFFARKEMKKELAKLGIENSKIK